MSYNYDYYIGLFHNFLFEIYSVPNFFQNGPTDGKPGDQNDYPNQRKTRVQMVLSEKSAKASKALRAYILRGEKSAPLSSPAAATSIIPVD